MSTRRRICAFATVFFAVSLGMLLTARTVYAYGSWDSVLPQPIASGGTLSVQTGHAGGPQGWENNAPVYFYWSADGTGTELYHQNATGTTLDASFPIPSGLADGSYPISACEGVNCSLSISYITTTITVLNPTPPPTAVPTKAPTAKATPVPTPTPTATPTPTPTATPIPTATPAPLVAVAPAAVVTPTPDPNALVAYNPVSEPTKVVDTQIAAFTLLTVGGAGAGGLAVTSMKGGLATAEHKHGAKSKSGGGKVVGAKIKHAKVHEGEARGDASNVWRWPGTATLDKLSLSVPLKVATFSPVLARVWTDASYMRAIAGSISLVLPVCGAVLGAYTAVDVNSTALSPNPGSAMGLLIIGIFDAGSGFLGLIAFTIAALFHGGLQNAPELRTLLGLAGLWFAIPLIASAARPLRRRPAQAWEQRWDRGADFVIASLIGAWAVQKIVAGLSGLAGYKLALAAYANEAALLVLAALIARVGIESLAANLFPRRLAIVQPAKVPFSPPTQRIAATLLRTAIVLFLAITVAGPVWQLWVAGLLFLVPQLLSIYERRFPNVPSLYQVMPRGIVKSVLMLFVGAGFGALVTHAISNPHEVVSDGLVLLAIPGTVLSLLDLFGREGKETDLTWTHRIAGLVILGIGVLFVLGFIG
jgi:hypothetical protein